MTNKLLASVGTTSDEHEFFSGTPPGYQKGKAKYIVVTGSVLSGAGKGTLTSCLAGLLKMVHGFRVAPVKFDGYLNYDAGTLNPYRHGEVFVLDDGTECDLDLGSYERMVHTNLTRDHYLTSGKIFKTIIDKERAGDYLGRDVQFIPHVTGEIKHFIRTLALKSGAAIVLIEVGGTVGDIENSYFLEAMRELAYEDGRQNVCFLDVVYVMRPASLGEYKSKPAQLGVKRLMGMGIQPDMIFCRSEIPVGDKVREKISIYSNVPMERVINNYNMDIYDIPLFLKEAGVDRQILQLLHLQSRRPDGEFRQWEVFIRKKKAASQEIAIAITGKYTDVQDSYLSIIKALEHSAPYCGARVQLKWIETTQVSARNAGEVLKDVHGIIVPGGFGERGTEGKIACIRYARENNLPYLGLCYGFQMAVIEFARNVCGLAGANTTEIDPKTKHPVICILPEQLQVSGLGGTMRLGGHEVVIEKGTLAHKVYGQNSIRKRFRHRYECNPAYLDLLRKKGMAFSGRAPEKQIMQILELRNHPFFVGTQFHPEFTSRPLDPEPIYKAFIEAAVTRKKGG